MKQRWMNMILIVVRNFNILTNVLRINEGFKNINEIIL